MAPFVRRILTGHDAQGHAVILSDERIPVGTRSCATRGLPIDTDTVLRIVDTMPSRSSPMHRTSSVDYGTVLSGEVDLALDDG